ncbi:hypothetical protein SAMN02745866_00677 [Alteromonadaceae bacterium Bs31]|nr:hypothetical protein SAMN02745866_00677 [Alteromonadaceae bacterium Bs31]
MSKLKESDWKCFCAIKDSAIKKYGERCLEEYREILNDESKDAIARHVLLHRVSDNLNRQFNLFFEGHSRSKVALQLLAIRAENLVEEESLRELSEELLARSDPKRVDW